MDVSGYRYDFKCLPKPKEDPNPEPEDKEEDPEEIEEKEELPKIKTKEDLIKYLTPNARQMYSSAAFAPYLDWMIDVMKARHKKKTEENKRRKLGGFLQSSLCFKSTESLYFLCQKLTFLYSKNYTNVQNQLGQS